MSAIVSSGRLEDLRWPDFADYRLDLTNFYRPSGYKLAWIRDGEPTPQALELFRYCRTRIRSSKALNIAARTGEGYALPELHRIKGELLMRSGDLNYSVNDPLRLAALSQARVCFDDAFLVAQQRGARSSILRVALSMHRLDLMLGNPHHTRLAEIYSSFTEGFETTDLRQARALLEIASPG